MLKVLFRTNKTTEEQEPEDSMIVGQTKAEGKELDTILLSLASDGGPVAKTKDGAMVSGTYIVEAHDKDYVKAVMSTSLNEGLGSTEPI
jgi:hypothetical protein